jgi:hypothetical protein
LRYSAVRAGVGSAYDGNQPISPYAEAADDIDGQIVDQQQVLSSYHNALFPWMADSSLKLKKGLPIPIDVRLFDGANNPLIKDDGIVSYKLFKSGQSGVLDSGPLYYDKYITKSWVGAIKPSKIPSKGTYFIEITLITPEGIHVTKDQIPAANPIYTNPITGNPLMSLKVTVT